MRRRLQLEGDSTLEPISVSVQDLRDLIKMADIAKKLMATTLQEIADHQLDESVTNLFKEN